VSQARIDSVTMLNRLYAEMLDLIFPITCAACGRVDHAVCPACRSAILHASPSPIAHQPAAPLSGAISTGWHMDGLRDCVITLKDADPPALITWLGERLQETLSAAPWRGDISLIVPVPLHRSRLRERGFNQSERLAAALASSATLPCQPDALARTRNTPHQVGLTGDERRQNMHDAFVASAPAVAEQHVLLVDDVFTTGATLQACAAALLQAGASSAYAITVSAAVG
jgi:competence protein ComFC